MFHTYGLFGTGSGILIAAAVIPAVFLLLQVYRADRLEKEPPGLLLSLLGLGVAATFAAMVTEMAGEWLLNTIFGNLYGDTATRLLYLFLDNFLIVALAEEGFKYLALRLRTRNDPHFNCQFDAVVYAVFVSLGFALWENLSYVFRGGLGTALLRAVTAVPGHACFGVFMGVFYGAAKRRDTYRDAAGSKLCRILAVLVPVLLHGAYDFLASLQNAGYTLIFLAFVGGMFVLAFLTVRRTSARDGYFRGTGTL